MSGRPGSGLVGPELSRKLRGSCGRILWSGAEQVLLLIRNDAYTLGAMLTAVDGVGKLRWHVDVPVGPLSPLRSVGDGAVWLGLPDRLCQYSSLGRERQVVALPVDRGERLGSFLVVPDGFFASFYWERSRFAGAEKLSGRVARLDMTGRVLWSTLLPAMAGEDVMRMWQPSQRKWRPSQWTADPCVSDPLLLAGGRLLASFIDPSSGFGRSYCLDTVSGTHLWTTPPDPCSSKAIAGDGQFLIGSQGYGLSETALLDRDGTPLRRWESHGYCLVSADGRILVVETEKALPSRSHVGRLQDDGSVERGAYLPEYFTNYPALSRDGRAVVWREGQLLLIEPTLHKRILWSGPTRIWEETPTSRMLLLPGGTLFFTVGRELWRFQTDLEPCADSPWPCGEGNPCGNPVYAYPGG